MWIHVLTRLLLFVAARKTFLGCMYNITTSDNLHRYSGNAWIELVIGGGSWEVRVKGNLTMRQDIGRINTSPITTATPILRLQHGCNHTVTIPGMKSQREF